MMLKNVYIVFAVMKHTWTKTLRRPVPLTFSFVQPMMWMIFFGFLFQRYIVEDSGTSNIKYIDFLLPGVCCMTLLFGASQSGISFIRDLQTGFLNRMLQTSANRSSILLGKILADTIRLVLQAVIILFLGVILGVNLTIDSWFLALSLFASFTFAIAYASLSSTIALSSGNQETMAAFIHVLNMPILFTSTALVPAKHVPEWLGFITELNPLSTIADISRFALIGQQTDFDIVRLFVIFALAIALFFLALRALNNSVHLDRQI